MATATSGEPREGRYCNHCGRPVSAGVRYCGHCGRELVNAIEVTTPPVSRSTTPRARTPSGDVGWIAGRAAVLFLRAGPKAWALGAVSLVLEYGPAAG